MNVIYIASILSYKTGILTNDTLVELLFVTNTPHLVRQIDKLALDSPNTIHESLLHFNKKKNSHSFLLGKCDTLF